MAKTIFDNPEFMKEVNERLEHAQSIAKEQNRDVIEVIKSETRKRIDERYALIQEDIKKRENREKYVVLSCSDTVHRASKYFRNNENALRLSCAPFLRDEESVAA